jgi:hypothetical protein
MWQKYSITSTKILSNMARNIIVIVDKLINNILKKMMPPDAFCLASLQLTP